MPDERDSLQRYRSADRYASGADGSTAAWSETSGVFGTSLQRWFGRHMDAMADALSVLNELQLDVGDLGVDQPALTCLDSREPRKVRRLRKLTTCTARRG